MPGRIIGRVAWRMCGRTIGRVIGRTTRRVVRRAAGRVERFGGTGHAADSAVDTPSAARKALDGATAPNTPPCILIICRAAS